MKAQQIYQLAKAKEESWYPLIDHPVQIELITTDVRFPLVPAGRRSGKTERFKRKLVKSANTVPGMYFAAAPTHAQAKKIFWKDLKTLSFSFLHPRRPSETELIIFFPNGSEIHVIGLDKPERIEGIPWAGGGIDEFANIKAKSWHENILPALNTVHPLRPGYLAWCWLLGVPDGLNHYYDLCEEADNGISEDYEVFTWFSADILDQLHPGLLDEQRKIMSPRQFRQEYEASFESATGRIYEDYGKHNKTQETIAPHEQLLWMHDFNFTPLSSAVGVVRDQDDLYLLDEVVLESAVARQSAEEFCEKYKDHQNKKLLLFGDPAGRAGEKHGHASDYVAMEQVLKEKGWEVTRKVKKKAPAIVARQNAVRAKVKSASGHTSLFVNPALAKYCDKGLATAQVMEGSSFQEKVTDFQHITTAIGYCVEHKWPVRHIIESQPHTPARNVNHW